VTAGLSRLPHQIPFRATSRIDVLGDDTAEGTFFWSFNDSLALGPPPEVLIVEAMAQTAGAIAFRGSSEPGFLSAIDEARFERPLRGGEKLTLRVKLVAAFGRIFRFEGVALDHETEVARARFYLASGEPDTAQSS
jgi:3-hydroxymyristoyl/3-hydroxydecanoyl-(acyl carrier protein) dehydratase